MNSSGTALILFKRPRYSPGRATPAHSCAYGMAKKRQPIDELIQ